MTVNISSTKKTAKQKSRAKSSRDHTADFGTLQQVRQESLKAHRRAPRTRAVYSAYVNQGFQFLRAVVAERRAAAERGEELLASDLDLSLLEKALDNPPNKYSAKVLELLLTERCFRIGLGKSTADGIHAAFNDYWNQM
jgi:hypothetical protein